MKNNQHDFHDHTKISPERQGLFNLGTGLAVIGVILIAIGFIGFAASGISSMNHSGFSGFGYQEKSNPIGFWICGAIGMVVTGIGRAIRGFAARGVAGSGLILDPQKARKDLAPWSKMAGGMLNDAGIAIGQKEKVSFDEELRRLAKLKEDGLINEAEFEEAKKKILAKIG